MKKILLFILLSSVFVLSACNILPDKKEAQEEKFTITIPEYYPAIETPVLTVNGEEVALGSRRLREWDVLVDVLLDEPAWAFDVVTSTKISNYSWHSLIYTVPSLDTPVCTRQTKEIEAASELFPDINFLVISNDTPFALERFCSEKDINNIHTLSDARTREFGLKNGFFLTDYALLTRAILVVDSDLNVLYVDYVEEVTGEADLLNAFAFIQDLSEGKNTDSIEDVSL